MSRYRVFGDVKSDAYQTNMTTPKPEPEYTPYGPEWEKELNRLPKHALIAMLRRACIDRDALRETLPYREKEGQP